MKELICIVCPRGCQLKVDESNNVTGNFCPRGAKYAITELTNPTRVVTSTVKLNGSVYNRVSVKTSSPIPKDKIFAVMDEINKVSVNAPTHIGDVVIRNVLNLNADIIITKNINK